MKIYINGEKEVNGYLKRTDNSFKIIVEDEIDENTFDFAHVYSDEYGIITCIYCRLFFGMMSEDIKTRVFTCEEVIMGKVNPKEISIKKILLHFKEMDAFFVTNRHKIEYPFKTSEQDWTLTQSFIVEELYRNDDVIISCYNMPNFYTNEFGENIFNNYYWISIEFYNKIPFQKIDNYIRKIEVCCGFVLKKKMNLVDLRIHGVELNKEDIYTVIKKNITSYNKMKWEDLHVVDISSLNILKSIINTYFESEIYMACINTFYEYIYNKLDMTFEFISLINLFDMFSISGKYKESLIEYSNSNSELTMNKEKLNNIYDKIESTIDEDEMKFLKDLIPKKIVSLNDKLKYFFYIVFEFDENEKSQKIIKSIKNTRKFFVHGTVEKDILEGVRLFIVKEIIKEMLYYQLIREVTEEDNINTRISQLSIKMLYDSIIKM